MSCQYTELWYASARISVDWTVKVLELRRNKKSYYGSITERAMYPMKFKSLQKVHAGKFNWRESRMDAELW